MKTKIKFESSSIGFCGFLALLFIALKLLDKIQWSWLWVLAPLWIPFILVAVFLMSILIWYVFREYAFKNKTKNRRYLK